MINSTKSDQDLRIFVEEKSGMLVMLSDDPLFVRTLRTAVFKTLAIKTDCLDVYQDAAQALRGVRRHVTNKMPVLVLADRILRGQRNLEFLRNIKTAIPEAKLLVMTQETSKDDLSQIYELGADSILTKPVSVDTLIEKMAGAIKPQGKISQMVQEARELLERGDVKRVMQISDGILKIKPGSPVAHMLQGDAHLLEGRRDDAIAAYETAHQGAKLYLEPLKKLADVHRESDEDTYLRYMRKLDNISPLNTERKCEIGKVYAARSDMARADHYFEAAIATAQREALSYVDRVVSEIAESVAESAPALAEKYYVKLLDMKGDNLTQEDMVTFNRLGIALRRQGKWREAVENYKKALTVVPSDERVLYNMGLAYADGQLHRMSVGCYDQVLRVAPEFHKTAPVVAYNMASAYAVSKDPAMARKMVDAALELSPEYAPALKLKAKMDQMNL